MHFISRVFLSWTLFVFLVVQSLDDDNVIKTLLPFLPLIVCTVASTYLVHDTILSRLPSHPTSEITASTFVDWAKPSSLVDSAVPITTLTTLGVIDRPGVSIWRGLFTGYAPLAFMAILAILAISITVIARRSGRHTVTLNHPPIPPSQVEPTIRGPPTVFTAQRYGAARLEPKAQATDFACPSYLPYGVLSKGPENETTTATLSQTLPDHIPILAPPPSVDNEPPKSTESDQSFDETLPLLGWNFTTSSEEDGDDIDYDEHDDEEMWLDAEDEEHVQIKDVARGIVSLSYHVEDEAEAGEEVPPAPTVPARVQELIPTRGINSSIELLRPRATQEAIAFPSREDEKHQGSAPPTSTPAPTGAPRARLRVPAAKPSPTIQSIKARQAREGLPFPSRKDKDEDEDEDDEDQTVQRRRPSVTRSPSRTRPRIPTGWQNPKVDLMQGLTPLTACIEEEEEEEENTPDQDQRPLSTSPPNRDASTSTTNTAVDTPTVAEVQNASGKPSAMKKKSSSEKKTATVSFVHFTEVRDIPKTICDVNARGGRFVSMEDEEGFDREYRLLKNLLEPDDEEVEENSWIPLESEEPELQPSLLSWNTLPQDDAAPEVPELPEAPEKINRSTRLREMFNKLPPLRVGKRLFKKTGPL